MVWRFEHVSADPTLSHALRGDHWRHAHGAAMGMYGRDLPILLALSRTTKWDDVGAGA